MNTKSICIVDFCGRYNNISPIQFWADWHPLRACVTFGGDWDTDQYIPTMPATTEPTDEQVHLWANKFGSPFQGG